jgi:hypothetical protein
MHLPRRTYTNEEYRFGFNGQERTDEINGVGNHNTALFWEYDTRLGRRWNLDPVPQISLSDYSVLSLNPILNVDPFGNSATNYEDENGKLIKKTDDGQNKTVKVKNEQRATFDIFVSVGEQKGVINSPLYNNWMSKILTDEVSTTDILLAGVGTSFSLAEKMSDIVRNSRSGYTSGKINPNSPKVYNKNFATKVFYGSKIIGFGLAGFSAIDTEMKYAKGDITPSRRSYNHTNNIVGIFLPAYAIPMAAGDYLGQRYEPIVTNSYTKPGGVLYDFTSTMLKIIGLPISKEDESK